MAIGVVVQKVLGGKHVHAIDRPADGDVPRHVEVVVDIGRDSGNAQLDRSRLDRIRADEHRAWRPGVAAFARLKYEVAARMDARCRGASCSYREVFARSRCRGAFRQYLVTRCRRLAIEPESAGRGDLIVSPPYPPRTQPTVSSFPTESCWCYCLGSIPMSSPHTPTFIHTNLHRSIIPIYETTGTACVSCLL